MDKTEAITGYRWLNAETNCSHEYLLPTVFAIIEGLNLKGSDRQVFDLGCGNGSVAACLSDRGYDVTGTDPSAEGIQQAKLTHPSSKVYQGSAYDDLAGQYGQFPVVISLEVVEHVYFPRKYAACVFSLLSRGG